MTQSTQFLCLENSSNEELIKIDIDSLDSPVLSRLIEEVRNESESTVRNYDRVHNRHNR